MMGVKTFVCITLFSLLPFTLCSDRKLDLTINPACPSCNFTFAHVTAAGPNDTIHYIWDFSRRPSLLLALTPVNESLSVDWQKFNSGSEKSIHLNSSKYSFGLIFNFVIEFDDTNNNGIFDEKEPSILYDTQDFTWKKLENQHDDASHAFVSLGISGGNYTNQNHSLNGTIELELITFGFKGHFEDLPRLLHSSNSTQIKLVFNNLSSSSNFSNGRFAVQLVLASSNPSNETIDIISRKTMDDENTPGVFKIVDMVTPTSADGSQGFLQWRPIVYTSKVASISNSTDSLTYEICHVGNVDLQLNHTLFYDFYGDDVYQYLVKRTLVSFGAKDDGFYKKTNYLTWTLLFGYGSPASEEFSMLVILIISIGLGLPAVILLAGGVFFCIRTCRRKGSETLTER